MSDLISRQAAIEGFYEMASDIDHLCTVSDYIHFLERLPSAEIRRKQGKWRVVSRQADFFTAYRCSECNELVYARTNFCPNCGVEMRGEANE